MSSSYEDDSEEWTTEAESSYFSTTGEEEPAVTSGRVTTPSNRPAPSDETSEFLSSDTVQAEKTAEKPAEEIEYSTTPTSPKTVANIHNEKGDDESKGETENESDESEWTSEEETLDEEESTEYESDSTTKTARGIPADIGRDVAPVQPKKPPPQESSSNLLSSSDEGESEWETEYETITGEEGTSRETTPEANDMNYLLSAAGHDRGKVVTPRDRARRQRRPPATKVEAPSVAVVEKSDSAEVEIEKESSSEVEVVRAESIDDDDSVSVDDLSSLVMEEVLDASKRRFMALPEPLPIDASAKDDIDHVFERLDYDDEMLSLQQSKITTFRDYLTVVEKEEVDLLASFQTTMSSWQPTDNTNALEEREEQRLDFESQLTSLRNRRAQFRGRLYDALTERENIIKSHLARHTTVFQLREKLDFWKERSGVDAWMLSFFTLQVVLLILFSLFFTHETVPSVLPGDSLHLRTLTLTSLFTILGLSFWMAVSKRYLWGAIGLNLLISAYAIEWGLLMHVFFKWAVDSQFQKLPLSPRFLTRGFYVAATTLISHAVILGRINAIGGIILATVEGFLIAVNFNIQQLWNLSDTGGSLHIWLFGALFGVAASFVYSRGDEVEVKESSLRHSYAQATFAWIGTLILWLTFPAFIAALAPVGSHNRVLVNVFMSLTSSALTAIALSHLFHGAHNLRSMLNAVLAGGVIMSGAANAIVEPGTAVALGVIAGAVAAIGEWKLNALLTGFGLVDAQSTVWLFAVPALVAWLCSEIVTSVARGFSFFGQNFVDLFSLMEPEHLAASWAITLLISIAGGVITGIILRLVRPDKYYAEPDSFKMTPAAYAF